MTPGSSSSIRRHSPEGATAAVEIATKFFWAFGYNQVESFLTTFDPKKTAIDPKATVRRPSGKRTRFTQDDVNAILETVARNADGTYRVIAGRLIPGKILGGFLYAGTRPDDPNDLVPHEHRRELRALRVFGAWTNLTDLKAANTLDALVTENGRTIVKHYLQDVGSTFGLCNDVHEWDLSYEYFYQGDASRKRLFSLGFALSPWQTIPYVEYPSIGKFEGTTSIPAKWRPQTPTTAYMELRDDDAFWAARRVAAFTDELIRAAVHTGQFSDPDAEKLSRRRADQAPRHDHALLPDGGEPDRQSASRRGGQLTFENAAVDGRRGGSAGHLSSLLAPLRQRHRRDHADLGDRERDDDHRRATGPAVEVGRSSPWTSPPTPSPIRRGSSRFARISARTAAAGSWWGSIGCRQNCRSESSRSRRTDRRVRMPCRCRNGTRWNGFLRTSVGNTGTTITLTASSAGMTACSSFVATASISQR